MSSGGGDYPNMGQARTKQRTQVDFEEHADRVGTGTNGWPVGATRALSLAEAHGMRRACTSLRDHIVFDLLYTNGLRAPSS